MSKEGVIYAINAGSSSLKFGAYRRSGGDECLIMSGVIDGIGHAGSKMKLRDAGGEVISDASSNAHSLEDAFSAAIAAFRDAKLEQPIALGHRIVHGGPHLRRHQRLTADVLSTLEQAVHFAPLHDPPAIKILHAAQRYFPGLPQFVCFDTAFHTTLPEVASHYAIPTTYWQQGVLRYGFHGLSYESIVRVLGNELRSRTIVAHLGSGASVCAIRDSRSIDTSMGLTPTGGVPMGTRSGDLDPSIVLWLQRSGLKLDEVESLLNQQSGLSGLSNGESDMRALLTAADQGDAPSRLAVTIFTDSVAKTIASYIVSLGGLDAIVFTGGIGENSAPIRHAVCDQLKPFSVAVDAARNQRSDSIISAADSTVSVRIIPADEDGQIALHTRRLLEGD